MRTIQTQGKVLEHPDQGETRRTSGPWGMLLIIIGLYVIGGIKSLFDFRHVNDDANVAAAKAQIKNFETLIVAYKMKLESVPSNLNDLVQNPLGINFMNARSLPKDPWGNDYVYSRRDDGSYLIITYGADGAPGGANYDSDITSDDLARNKN